MSALFRLTGAVVWLAAAACSADAVVAGADSTPAPPPSAGERPGPPVRGWTESFDHRGQLQGIDGSAVLDSNRGLLTLFVESLPHLGGTGEFFVDQEKASFGLAEGQVLEVTDNIDVGDGLELRASNALKVSGQLRAGEGGLLLAAGRSIEINGELSSTGPIELVITELTGEIVVRGSIRAPLIRLRGRGSTRILGLIDAEASPGPTGFGEIHVELYGAVSLEGPSAALRSGDEGTVRIETLNELRFRDGARAIDPGTWSIGAGQVLVDEGSALVVGGLSVVAEDELRLGAEVEIETGGDEASFVASAIELGLGTRIDGVASGGTSLRIEAAEELRARDAATVTSVSPSCSQGEVVVRVGGPYRGEGVASFLPAPIAAVCPPEARRPEATVIAHRIEGQAPVLGTPDARAVEDPNLRVSVPTLQTHASGRWISQPFIVPTGVSLTMGSFMGELAEGTGLTVLVGSTQRPDTEPLELRPFEDGWTANDRFVVVRLDLYGRRFDAPRLEEISLVW